MSWASRESQISKYLETHQIFDQIYRTFARQQVEQKLNKYLRVHQPMYKILCAAVLLV
jgi:hypothetical protein